MPNMKFKLKNIGSEIVVKRYITYMYVINKVLKLNTPLQQLIHQTKSWLPNFKNYFCMFPKQMYTSEVILAADQQSHVNVIESSKYECKTCRETFTTRSKLSVHLWSHAVRPSHKTFKYVIVFLTLNPCKQLIPS